MPVLEPPFYESYSLISDADSSLPALVHYADSRRSLRPRENKHEYLTFELTTPKLDALYDQLWLAGLPLPVRHLQRQAMIGRVVYITERPDEHLVWHQTKLLVKPLPPYLLSYGFWKENLCADRALHESAVGFLLSYVWLVQYRSDFALAQRERLLPRELVWDRWAIFVDNFCTKVDPENFCSHVSRRYLYGELRLSRLNSLMRFHPSFWSLGNFVRGYLPTSTWYQAFFETNFSWYLAVFAFISIILSAMQVGLATPQLNDSQPFKNMSYGISVFSIAFVFFAISLMGAVWAFLCVYHVWATKGLNRRVERARTMSVPPKTV